MPLFGFPQDAGPKNDFSDFIQKLMQQRAQNAIAQRQLQSEDAYRQAQMKQFPVENQLHLAQMAAVQANAQKASMIARLMNRASGVNGGSTTGNNDDAQDAHDKLIQLGIFKETPKEQEARELREAREKSKINVEEDTNKKQNENMQKQSQALIDAGNAILKYSHNTTGLTDYFEKGGKTGPVKGIMNFLNLSGGDAGAFNALSIPLIGKLTKELSTRGGATVSRIASSAKPDYRKPTEYNVENLNEIHRQEYAAYQDAKNQYEKLTGKEYPIKLPDFYDRVAVKSPLGHIKFTDIKNAQRLMQKYPGSKILGKAYEKKYD